MRACVYRCPSIVYLCFVMPSFCLKTCGVPIFVLTPPENSTGVLLAVPYRVLQTTLFLREHGMKITITCFLLNATR